MMSGKTIGVISIKGGVGKTTVVSNLASSLAKLGKKTLVVDGNISAPNLGLHLGILNSQYTLHDVLFSNVPVWKAVRKSEFGFDVITGSLLPKKNQKVRINPYKLHNRLSDVKKEYDYIIIDSSPNLNEEMLSTMIASDELLVVTSPDYPTLSCTMHAVKVARERKTPIAGLVLNKVRNKDFELSVSDIENATGIPVLSVIGDDVKVLEALSKTSPASSYFPKDDFSVAYGMLAAKISGERYEDPRVLSRLFNLFRR
jgi:septum site-determining protein MinD